MSTRTWSGRAAAGLLVALAGCAHHAAQQGEAGPAEPPQVRRADAQAAQADQAVAEAQRRLQAANQASIAAEQQRAQAQAQLAQGQQRAEQAQQRIAVEQTNLQRAEEAARQSHAQATDAAMQAQLQAEQAQGLRSASGRITEATPSRVVLQAANGQTSVFEIDPRTRVLMGTQARSIADLQEGAQARVAYDPRSSPAAAVAIHVTPARSGNAPAPAQPRQR